MSKKDKKIEIQLIDHKVMVNQTKIDGYQLQIGLLYTYDADDELDGVDFGG